MMKIKSISIFLCAIVLTLAGVTYFIYRGLHRETIFDRVISIPKEFVRDIPYLPPLCDSIKGLKKGFVDVDHGRLYYEEEGNGVPLVLVNPGPGGTHHFFHPYFSQLKDSARIIYYDARGTGQSSIDETGKLYTIKQAVEDIESLRKALKIDKWAVLGWSFGGFLAQCYALTYPEHVLGLILVNSLYGREGDNLKPGRRRQFISQSELDFGKRVSKAEAAGVLTADQAVYNRFLVYDWKQQHYYKPSREKFIYEMLYEWKPAKGYNSIISSDVNDIDLAHKFDDFEIPTLLMESKWDLTWDTDKAEFMRKNHLHAQFAYFEKSGHGIFMDEPEKFFAVVRAFLKQVSFAQISYKSGNRIKFPEPPSELAYKVIMASERKDRDAQKKEMGALFHRALHTKSVDQELWRVFLSYFYENKNYAEALEVFKYYEQAMSADERLQRGCWLKATCGKLLDLLGRRVEAIKCYQEALRIYDRQNNKCSGIDRALLEEHIKTPYLS